MKMRHVHWKAWRQQHQHYRHSGLYAVLGPNLAKLLLTVLLLIAAVLLLKPVLAPFQDGLLALIQEQLSPPAVFAFFYLSESVLGLVPPDIFMLWAAVRFPEQAWDVITLLALLSYVGGVTAYVIGRRIEHLPRVHRFLFERHAQHVQFMQRWGGVFIVIAALLPIPFAIASTAAGLVEYPLRSYLLFAVARFARFYLYAWVLFALL